MLFHKPAQARSDQRLLSSARLPREIADSTEALEIARLRRSQKSIVKIALTSKVTAPRTFYNHNVSSLARWLWCKLDSVARLAGLFCIEFPQWGQAASATLHSSDMVAFRFLSLPVLNWPFLIFSANSIPLRVTDALSNRLNPSIGRTR